MSEIISVFGINWKLLIIQIVNFGVLLLLLRHFLYKPLLRIIEERRRKIAEGLTDAAEAKNALLKLDLEKAAHEKYLLEESDRVVKDAREKAREEEKEILRKAEEKRALILKDAEREGAGEKEKILSGAKEEIVRMAVLAAEKILKNQDQSVRN